MTVVPLPSSEVPACDWPNPYARAGRDVCSCHDRPRSITPSIRASGRLGWNGAEWFCMTCYLTLPVVWNEPPNHLRDTTPLPIGPTDPFYEQTTALYRVRAASNQDWGPAHERLDRRRSGTPNRSPFFRARRPAWLRTLVNR